ncbi:hypothetical protein BAL199_19963 [alpha proteobacterium BAL199]|nr:hypothetical protein BAL199_19963 [alpha proteobacterium BAL199]
MDMDKAEAKSFPKKRVVVGKAKSINYDGAGIRHPRKRPFSQFALATLTVYLGSY